MENFTFWISGGLDKIVWRLALGQNINSNTEHFHCYDFSILCFYMWYAILFHGLFYDYVQLYFGHYTRILYQNRANPQFGIYAIFVGTWYFRGVGFNYVLQDFIKIALHSMRQIVQKGRV